MVGIREGRKDERLDQKGTKFFRSLNFRLSHTREGGKKEEENFHHSSSFQFLLWRWQVLFFISLFSLAKRLAKGGRVIDPASTTQPANQHAGLYHYVVDVVNKEDGKYDIISAHCH